MGEQFLKTPRFIFDKDDGGGGEAPESQNPDHVDPNPEPEKKYTDKELNALLLKKTGSAIASEYRALGFESKEQLQERLKRLDEIEKADMTETEKLKKELAERDARDAERDREKKASDARLAAYKLNVADEYIEDVIKLVPDGEDSIDDRMKAYLESRPVYLRKDGKDFGNKQKNQQGNEADLLKAKIRKGMGLKD